MNESKETIQMDNIFEYSCNNYTLNIITNYNKVFEEYNIIIIYYQSHVIAYVNIVLPLNLILPIILEDLKQIFQNTTQTNYIYSFIYNPNLPPVKYDDPHEPGYYETWIHIERDANDNTISFDTSKIQAIEFIKILNILKKLNV